MSKFSSATSTFKNLNEKNIFSSYLKNKRSLEEIFFVLNELKKSIDKYRHTIDCSSEEFLKLVSIRASVQKEFENILIIFKYIEKIPYKKPREIIYNEDFFFPVTDPEDWTSIEPDDYGSPTWRIVDGQENYFSMIECVNKSFDHEGLYILTTIEEALEYLKEIVKCVSIHYRQNIRSLKRLF